MGRVTIRAAERRDTDAILAINAAGQPGVAPLTAGEIAAIGGGAPRCWVAVGAPEPGEGVATEERVRGYLIAYGADAVYDGEEFAWFRARYEAFLYIDQIAIAPGSRHGGVGAALYRAVAAEAQATGYERLTCEVNLEPPNPISLRFHDKNGFARVGTMATHDGRTVALLRRELREARQAR